MFARLVQKELLHHLLDFRFTAVFLLCTVLSVLSVYVGIWSYVPRLEEYNRGSESNLAWVKRSVENNQPYSLQAYGYTWNKRPEVLSSVVHGLSGKLGREVHIHHKGLFQFDRSLFSADPIHSLFGILDFAYIVKIILSLCVLLLTYDAVCGEKEGGTLRLYQSFPVRKSSLAMAKIGGSTIAVLVPFVFSFILAWAVLALFPGTGLRAEDWGRLVFLMVIFSLYLIVFAAFGLFVSALTHRRLNAFLGLLGLWTVWVFILPNLGVGTAQVIEPVDSIYEQEKMVNKVRGKMRAELQAAMRASTRRFFKRHGLTGAERPYISKDLYKQQREEQRKHLASLQTEYYSRLRPLLIERRNQIRRQQNLAITLSAISPLSALNFASMDLARTGTAHQERLENALDAYHQYMGRFWKERHSQDEVIITDFALFNYQDPDTLSDSISRNLFHVLNLMLLAILGFAGAYVAILRYDVR